MERVVNQRSPIRDFRLLLSGKTGSGVSASGNCIIGENVFPSKRSLKSTTDRCKPHTADVSNRRVTVIDAPTFFNTLNIDLNVEFMRGMNMCSSGFHAILLVFSLHTFTQQDMEVVTSFNKKFGKNAMKHTFVLFTNGDQLQNQSVSQLIKENAELSKLIKECGGRFHSLNNKDLNDREQVKELLEKIEQMVSENQNKCYTLQMYKIQAFKVFLLSSYLYAVNVVIVFALGYVNMRNEGSFDVKTFLYGCAGGVLAAVTGATSGAVCTQICNNHRWRTSGFAEDDLNYAKYLAIMCSCAAGGISVYFMGPVGFSTTLLRGIQGGVAYNVLRYHHR